MPSLVRFLTLVAIAGGTIFGAMFLLAQFYQPPQREITVTVPADHFAKQK